MTELISIKGIRDGLLATLSDGETWETISKALLARIDQSADFFKGAKLTLAVGPRAISAAELGRLREALSERNVGLAVVLTESAATHKAAQALGMSIAPAATLHTPQADPEIDSEEAGEAAILVRRTIRSGRSVHHSGHVTVLGDVNAGAEIIAGGDIVVWGRLRGVAHAGANGNENALVCALDLSPTQLRIAGKIAISPARKGAPKPEVAKIRDGQIVAEPWNTK